MYLPWVRELIKEMAGCTSSELVGLYLKSAAPRGGLLPRWGVGVGTEAGSQGKVTQAYSQVVQNRACPAYACRVNGEASSSRSWTYGEYSGQPAQ